MTLATRAPATAAGTFKISGKHEVARLGFGTMQLTGKGTWGPPADIDGAKRIMRQARDLGITLFDTADSYGPEISETMVHDALSPYTGIVIATKGGLTRPGPNIWVPNGKPEYLREAVLGSLRRLGLAMIPVWQLHRIDPKIPRDEQFGMVAELRAEGLIDQIGLSEATVDDIRAAEAFFKVATVQNIYNLSNRKYDDVIAYCETNNIGFIPWYPLGNGALAKPGRLTDIAAKHGATPAQIALAWLLKRSPVMLPIPGTKSAAHLEENVAAAAIKLDADDMAVLSD